MKFKKYLNRKNQSGYEQSYKIYECEDCSDCPLKPQCTKAKGNRQIHWNPIYEEMKAKAKAALECEEKAAIYAQRKVEVESVFGHIKGNRSFRFSFLDTKKSLFLYGRVNPLISYTPYCFKIIINRKASLSNFVSHISHMRINRSSFRF